MRDYKGNILEFSKHDWAHLHDCVYHVTKEYAN